MHDILGCTENGRDDDELLVSSDAPFDDNDADAFSTNASPSLKMGCNRMIPVLDPRMIGPPFLRLHPLLCPFRQKSLCKINLHHPTTPPLKTLLAMNLLPNKTNLHLPPKEKVLATTT